MNGQLINEQVIQSVSDFIKRTNELMLRVGELTMVGLLLEQAFFSRLEEGGKDEEGEEEKLREEFRKQYKNIVRYGMFREGLREERGGE